MAVEDLFQELVDARSAGQRARQETQELSNFSGLDRSVTRPIADPNLIRQQIIQSRYKDTGAADDIAANFQDERVQQALQRSQNTKLEGRFKDAVTRFGSMRSTYKLDQSIALADREKKEELMGLKRAIMAIEGEAAEEDTSGFLGDLSSTMGYMYQRMEDSVKAAGVAGAAGAVIGGVVGGVPGAIAGAKLGAAKGMLWGGLGGGALQGKGMIYANLREEGISHENAEIVSTAGGAAYSAIEQVTTFLPKGMQPALINNIFRSVDRNVRKAAFRTVANIVAGGIGETLEEGFQKGTEDVSLMFAQYLQDGLDEEGHPLAQITGTEIFRNMVQEAWDAMPVSMTLAGAFGGARVAGKAITGKAPTQLARQAQVLEAELGIKPEQAEKMFQESLAEVETRNKAAEEADKGKRFLEAKTPELSQDAAMDIYLEKLGAIKGEGEAKIEAEKQAVASEEQKQADILAKAERQKFAETLETPEMMDRIFLEGDTDLEEQAVQRLGDEGVEVLRERWTTSVIESAIEDVLDSVDPNLELSDKDMASGIKATLKTRGFSDAWIKENLPSVDTENKTLTPRQKWEESINKRAVEIEKRKQAADEKQARKIEQVESIKRGADEAFASNNTASIEKLRKVLTPEEFDARRQEWKRGVIEAAQAKETELVSGIARELAQAERIQLVSRILEEQGLGQTARREVLNDIFPKRRGSLSAAEMAEQFKNTQMLPDVQAVVDGIKVPVERAAIDSPVGTTLPKAKSNATLQDEMEFDEEARLGRDLTRDEKAAIYDKAKAESTRELDEAINKLPVGTRVQEAQGARVWEKREGYWLEVVDSTGRNISEVAAAKRDDPSLSRGVIVATPEARGGVVEGEGIQTPTPAVSPAVAPVAASQEMTPAVKPAFVLEKSADEQQESARVESNARQLASVLTEKPVGMSDAKKALGIKAEGTTEEVKAAFKAARDAGLVVGGIGKSNWRVPTEKEKNRYAANKEVQDIANFGKKKENADKIQARTGITVVGETRAETRSEKKQTVDSGRVYILNEKYTRDGKDYVKVDVYDTKLQKTGDKDSKNVDTLVKSDFEMLEDDYVQKFLAYKTRDERYNTIKSSAMARPGTAAKKIVDVAPQKMVAKPEANRALVLTKVRERIQAMTDDERAGVLKMGRDQGSVYVRDLLVKELEAKSVLNADEQQLLDSLRDFDIEENTPETRPEAKLPEEDAKRIGTAAKKKYDRFVDLINDDKADVFAPALIEMANGDAADVKARLKAFGINKRNIDKVLAAKTDKEKAIAVLNAMMSQSAENANTYIEGIDALLGKGFVKDEKQQKAEKKSDTLKAELDEEIARIKENEDGLTPAEVKEEIRLARQQYLQDIGDSRAQTAYRPPVGQAALDQELINIAERYGATLSDDKKTMTKNGIKFNVVYKTGLTDKNGNAANGLNVRVRDRLGRVSEYTLYLNPETADVTTTAHEFIHAIMDKLTTAEKALLAKQFGLKEWNVDVDEAVTQEIAQAVVEGRELGTLGSTTRKAWEKVKVIVDALMHLRFGEAWNALKELPDAVRAERLKGLIQSGKPLGRQMEARLEGGDREMPVYHGTPHLFAPEGKHKHGRFRLDKMGTGDGSQAYGWGIYFADKKETAEQYKELRGDKLLGQGPMREAVKAAEHGDINKAILLANEEVSRLMDMGNERKNKKLSTDFTDRLIEEAVEIRDFIKSGKVKPTQESLYRLDIPDDVMSKLMDWDRPITTKQAIDISYELKGLSDSEIGDIARFGELQNEFSKPDPTITGEEVYLLLSRALRYTEKEGTEFLTRAGILGNTHGGVSRGGTGAQYVIWDQATLDRIVMLERNGKALDQIQEEQRAQLTTEPARAQVATKPTEKAVDAARAALSKEHGAGWALKQWRALPKEGRPTFGEWAIAQVNKGDTKSAWEKKALDSIGKVADTELAGDFSDKRSPVSYLKNLGNRARSAYYGMIDDVRKMEVISPKLARMVLEKQAQIQGGTGELKKKYINKYKLTPELQKKATQTETASFYDADGKQRKFSVNFGKMTVAASQVMSADFTPESQKGREGGSRPMAEIIKKGLVFMVDGKRNVVRIRNEAERQAFISSLSGDVKKEAQRLHEINSELYKETNAVFKRMYGFDLKQRDFYAHVYREYSGTRKGEKDSATQHVGLMALMYSDNAVTPAEIERLTGAGEGGLVVGDIYKTISSTLDNTVAFITMGEFVRDMKNLLKSEELTTLAKHRLGNSQPLYETWHKSMIRSVESMGGTFENVDITTQKFSKYIRKFLGNAGKSFMADPFTSLKQAGSFANLAGYFGTDIWAKGSGTVISKSEMQKYIDGGYGVIKYRTDPDVRGGYVNVMDDSLAQRSAANITGNLTKMDKYSAVQDATMVLTRKIDQKTVNQAIKMAKIKIDQTWKGPKDQSYYQAVGREADMAVMATQVPTSDINRTNMQRMKSGGTSALTFMRGARAMSLSNILGSMERYFATKSHLNQVRLNGGDVAVAQAEVNEASKQFKGQLVYHGLIQGAIISAISMGKVGALNLIAGAFGDDDDDEGKKAKSLMDYGLDLLSGTASNMMGLMPFGDTAYSWATAFTKDSADAKRMVDRVTSEVTPVSGLLEGAFKIPYDRARIGSYEKQLATGMAPDGKRRLTRKELANIEERLSNAEWNQYLDLAENLSTWAFGFGPVRTGVQVTRSVRRNMK